MKLNQKRAPIHTHEGGKAKHINAEQALRRSCLSCVLWEREFYEDGQDIASRILSLAAQVTDRVVADLAIEARSRFHLRHLPLLLCISLVERRSELARDTIAECIQRPDELTELLAIYWRDGKKPLSSKLKKGLAKAFEKFGPYALAKYNRRSAIQLRDVMFLVHPKPTSEAQEKTWKQLADQQLASPDTWEVALSAGADKAKTFERLIREGKLGYMALLRNLRNMEQAGVDRGLVADAIRARKGASRVLPYRYIAAAKHAPGFEPALDAAMIDAMQDLDPLSGHTVILVDHSFSMNWELSRKSDMNRFDAACGLAILLAGICEQFTALCFSSTMVQVPPRQGMALRDALRDCMLWKSTYLGRAVEVVNSNVMGQRIDRLVVITDEQSHDRVPNPECRGYMINVASARNGVGYGPWVHIDGFSEAAVRFIQEYEAA